MAELKIVLYSENRAPRAIALTTRVLYRTLTFAVVGAVALATMTGLAVRFYLVSKAKNSQTVVVASSESEAPGPSNSLEEQNRNLRDQIEQLNAKLTNSAAASAAPKEIDKKNPALALFSPIVVDRTQNQDQVSIGNFRYSKASGKSPATLTFDLKNNHPDASTEKGYIVVAARSDKALNAYPNVFNRTGPFLLDFEKGETFQVARFRLVNAQFDSDSQSFQIFIFTRKGELLINTTYEVK